MATDLCEGAIQLNCAKTRLKMTKILTSVRDSELMVKQ